MLWRRVVETWQSFSSVVRISKGGVAYDRRNEANVLAAEDREAASDDWEQQSSRMWRREDTEQIYTDSLHMSS